MSGADVKPDRRWHAVLRTRAGAKRGERMIDAINRALDERDVLRARVDKAEKELTELRDTVTYFREEIAKVRARLSEEEGESAGLGVRLLDVEQDRDDLRGRLERLQAAHGELADQAVGFARERDELRDKLTVARMQRDSAEADAENGGRMCDVLRAHVQVLADDVERALACRQQKGGQHAGIPHLAAATPGVLLHVQQACRDALAACDTPQSADTHGRAAWLVFILRDGGQAETTFAPFEAESDARAFFDQASEQWSDSYLCRVVRGPRDDLAMPAAEPRHGPTCPCDPEDGDCAGKG